MVMGSVGVGGGEEGSAEGGVIAQNGDWRMKGWDDGWMGGSNGGMAGWIRGLGDGW